MPDLETRLRTSLHRRADEITTVPGLRGFPERSAHRTIRQARRSRLVVASTCLAVAATLAVGYVVGRDRPVMFDPSRPVPWADLRYTRERAAAPRAGDPFCTDVSLTILNGMTTEDSPADTHHGELELHNRTDSACSIHGAPAIHLLDQRSREIPVSVRNDAPSGVRIPAGGRVALPFTWYAPFCPAEPVTRVQVEVRGVGEQVMLAPIRDMITNVSGIPSCSIVSFPRPAATGDFSLGTWLEATPQEGALQRASISLRGPETVPYPEPVLYQLVLRNNTDHPISMSPCPTYGDQIGGRLHMVPADAPPPVKILNCAQAPKEIAPHTELIFDLREETPDTVAADPWPAGATDPVRLRLYPSRGEYRAPGYADWDFAWIAPEPST